MEKPSLENIRNLPVREVPVLGPLLFGEKPDFYDWCVGDMAKMLTIAARHPVTGIRKVMGSRKWRGINSRIEEIAQQQGDEFFVVQIGANDGQHYDPIHRFVTKHQWQGLMVEPVPHTFKALSETYKSQPQLQLANVAIADQSGPLTMHMVPPEMKRFQGLHSSSKEFLERISFTHDFGDLLADTVEIEVEALTMDDLFASYDVERVNGLVIDTEGADYGIFNQFPLGKFLPELVMVEVEHMPGKQRGDIMNRLGEFDYDMMIADRDLIGFRN